VRHQSGPAGEGRDGRGDGLSGGTMISLQPCNLTESSQCQALGESGYRALSGRIDVPCITMQPGLTSTGWKTYRMPNGRATLDEEVSLVFLSDTGPAWPHLKKSHGVIRQLPLRATCLGKPLTSVGSPCAQHSEGRHYCTHPATWPWKGVRFGIRANSISPGVIVHEANSREQLQDPGLGKRHDGSNFLLQRLSARPEEDCQGGPVFLAFAG